MTVDLSQIPGALYLPRMNWETIRAWVEKHVKESDRPQAWADIVDQWLGLLNEALGNQYQTANGDQVILFAPAGYEHVESMLDQAETGLAAIAYALGSMASENRLGKLPVLLLADVDTYTRYTWPYYPEGQYTRSAGVCIREGYVHIALYASAPHSVERTMIHEITHACLAHLTLPLWLEEGATQLAEEAGLANWARFQLDAETAKGMRDYWHENELSNFWWGKGFFLTDDAQMPSYQLAQVLFHLLLSDHRRQLPDFVRHAHAADAGDSSAREHLGKSVGDLAAQFLGPGSWEPVPPDVETYCGRAHLYLTRSQYGQAIADLDEALRLDPARSDAFSNRGFARQKTGDYAAARSDFERAIELDDKHFDAHNNLAWLLATCPDDDFRDGPRALVHAKQACELTGFGTWYCAGTLAAAYAELGDFEEARTWARETVQQAPDDEREACKQRLKLYREGKPYRDVQNADVRPTATKTTNRMEL